MQIQKLLIQAQRLTDRALADGVQRPEFRMDAGVAVRVLSLAADAEHAAISGQLRHRLQQYVRALEHGLPALRHAAYDTYYNNETAAQAALTRYRDRIDILGWLQLLLLESAPIDEAAVRVVLDAPRRQQEIEKLQQQLHTAETTADMAIEKCEAAQAAVRFWETSGLCIRCGMLVSERECASRRHTVDCAGPAVPFAQVLNVIRIEATSMYGRQLLEIDRWRRLVERVAMAEIDARGPRPGCVRKQLDDELRRAIMACVAAADHGPAETKGENDA